MATFLDLTDSPSDYNGKALKFVRVNGSENALSIAGVDLNDLSDVNASGGYAPTDTQILQFSSAAGEWRPMANDPYSPGNGLNKSAGTFNVVGGAGIEANTSGVHIADVGTAGTYGSGSQVPVITTNSRGQVTSVTPTDITIAAASSLTAEYVANAVGTAGQISVTGGTGNSSSATINLVATGVTSGTYGNSTTIPQITVDSYGRIQNVDLVASAANGSGSAGTVDSAFKNIAVTGQTTISSDSTADTVTFTDGSGIDITTAAGTDTITFSANMSEIGAGLSTASISDIATTTPTNGQVLKYNSTSSKYEPFTLTDATGIALTDLSGATGITYDNTTGAISLTNTGVTAKTYGNVSLIPQITVNAQGQITNISNVSIDDASGVTAGTYGTATTMPQFAVNSAGKITSVSNVSIAASTQTLSWDAATDVIGISGGNTIDISTIRQNGFGIFSVSGQDNLVADASNDVLNIVAGTGISLTTNAGNDTLTITNSGVTSGLNDLSDVSTAGASSGQVLKYNGTSWAPSSDLTGGGGGGISLSDLSITTASASGSGSLAYNNTSGVFTFTPADLSSITTTLAGLTDTTISSPSTNQIIKYDGSRWINADQSSAYGDSQVATYLSNQGFATQSTIVAAITDSAPGTLDTLNELAAALGDDPNYAATTSTALGHRLRTDVNNQNLSNTQKSNAVTNLGLSGVATAGTFASLTGKPTTIAGYGISDAFDGAFSSLSSRPTLTLSSSNLTYDGTTVDLSGVGATGPQGPQGATGPAGPQGSQGTAGNGVTNVAITSDELIFTYANSSVQNLGSVKGNTGATGPQGPAGTSISSGAVNAGTLTLTMSDSSTVTVSGNVQGATGATGATGPTGPQGPAGGGVALTDLSTSTAAPSSGGSLVYNNSNGQFAFTPAVNTIVGNSDFALTGSLTNNDALIYVSGSGKWTNLPSPLWSNAVTDGSASTGQVLKWNGSAWAPATDVSGSGGIASLVADTSPQLGGTLDANGNNINMGTNNITDVKVGRWDDAWTWGNHASAGYLSTETFTSLVQDTTPQLGGSLDVNGQDITSASNGNIELDPHGTGKVIFKGNSGNGGNGAGRFQLNCENNSHGITIQGPPHSAAANYTLTLPNDDGSADQVLKTDGSGVLSWVDQSGGGGGATALNGLSDVSTAGVTTGQVLKYNGTSWAPAADNNSGGGGGSGAKILRFKLNYDSSGNLSSTSNLSTGISSANIDSASGGDMTILFDSGTYNYPPGSIMIYGYDHSNNKYLLSQLSTTMTLREIAGGGSSGSPTFFDGSSAVSLKLRLREAETGASRGFGTTTHAWVAFTMYD